MTILIRSLSRAFAQTGDPAFRNVMMMGVAGAIIVFIILWILASWVVGVIPWSDLPYVGWIFGGVVAAIEWVGDWLGWLVDLAFFSVMLSVTFLLFPAVTTMIVSLFLDKIAGAVEDVHYAGRPPPRAQKLTEIIGESAKFLGVTIGVNILALPIYALLLFLPPFNLVFYYWLNGYLVGREFYEMVAVRRLSPHTALLLRKRCGALITLGGALIVFGMTIPILNLFTPVLAAAMMVHVFEAVRAREGVPIESDAPAPDASDRGAQAAGPRASASSDVARRSSRGDLRDPSA